MAYPEVHTWIRSLLPPPPARVLEVGAGAGELAAALREDGHDVLAIDPGDRADGVERLALAELAVPEPAVDAAVAVVALHHVEPLAESLAVLGDAVRPGGSLIVDEFDAEAFDVRAAAWMIERRAHHEHVDDPADLVAEIRGHLHSVAELRLQLVAAGFELGPLERGPYLHRWDLEPGHEPEERRLIEAGRLPAVGARFSGRRRSD